MQTAPSICPELGRRTQGLRPSAAAREGDDVRSREGGAIGLRAETCSSATGEVWVAALEQIPA
jgi:hypothetical protein